ncbi:MAG: YitT family protein [bacterium]|nr:YitT family protein [bacterium]
MNNASKQFEFYKYCVLSFLMFISAINYNMLISPGHIVAGGSNGISIIINQFVSVESSLIIFLLSVGFLLVALAFGEHKLVLSSLYASLIYPFFVKLTSNLFGFIDINSTSMVVVAIFSGLISGLVSGTVYRFNIGQGGIFLISQIIGKKFKVSISKISFVINSIIVILGGFVFGITSILYAIIFLVASKISMDKVILGTSSKKLFQIITSKTEAVEDYIKNEIKSGYTIFNALGTTPTYKDKKQIVIMTTIYTIDYFKLKEGIKSIDEDAFILITDSYQSKGGNKNYNVL